MKKNNIKFFNETLYEETLENGMKVYIIPNDNVLDTFVTFTAKYGGCNYEFKYNNKFVKLPNGVAHFLEHKMFEQKNRVEPFTFFGRTGTYSNAATNYHNTYYIFAGNNNFKENLNYLLDFVQDPYFTDENVEKEKGIIAQEIKMYDDIPDRIIYEKNIYNLFNNNPTRYSIGGSVEDITKITKEDLKKAYDVFYQPSNMFITITGKVNPNEAIEIIKENQKNKKFKKTKIEIKNIEEKDKVYKEEEIINMNINTPYISYGIKIPTKKLENIEKKKRNMYLSTIFNILFEETSLLYEELKENKLIETPIDIESLDTNSHEAFILIFKSNNYKEVIKRIDKKLKDIKIEECDLKRKRKSYISNLIYMFDDISETNRMIVNNNVLYNDNYTNIYDLIEDMNIDELNEIIKNLDLTNKSICIIKN